MTKYFCDRCGKEIVNPEKEGLLHTLEDCSCVEGQMRGFAFYRWVKAVADMPDEYGHIHTACIVPQLDEYLRSYKLGRIVLGNRSVVITPGRMADRKRRNADAKSE